MVCQVFTLKNLALTLNKFFFAVQQYTEPSGILGKDITPDSGVVMESRQPSRVSTLDQSFGSGSTWVSIGLAPWIRIRIEVKSGSGSALKPVQIRNSALDTLVPRAKLCFVFAIGRFSQVYICIIAGFRNNFQNHMRPSCTHSQRSNCAAVGTLKWLRKAFQN